MIGAITMASYQNSTAYNLSMFEPARKRKPASTQGPRLVKPGQAARRTQAKLAAERRASMLKVVEFAVVAILCVALIAPNIFSRIKVNELNSKIVEMTMELNEVKSENTRLDMELKSKISLENVQNYAENVLGMVKRDRYQVHYFNIENSNEIINAQ